MHERTENYLVYLFSTWYDCTLYYIHKQTGYRTIFSLGNTAHAPKDEMAGREPSLGNIIDGAMLVPESKRRIVSIKTVEKWVVENEKALSTI